MPDTGEHLRSFSVSWLRGILKCRWCIAAGEECCHELRFYLHPLIHLFNFTPFPKTKFCFVTERLHRDIAAILLPCSMDPGRTNWSAPLDSSWARRDKELTALANKSVSGWIMENHNTASLPPVWLGALHITNHYTTQSCIFGNWSAEHSAIKRTTSRADLAMWVGTAWDSGVTAPDPCLWCLQAHLLPAGCQGSQLLCDPAGAQGTRGWCRGRSL